MNNFAPHAVHANPPCMPDPYCCAYNPPSCPRCHLSGHRALEQTYTIPPTCPCHYPSTPLTVNVNGPVLTPLITCCGGPPRQPQPNRLVLNPEAMGRPACNGWGGGVPAYTCAQRAPGRCARGF